MAKVEFHFDVGSPNAYLSHLVIPEIEKRTAVRFDYVPILLGGVFKLTNNRWPHLKGSFTGADRRHPGLIEQANGGTLFLDEISEMRSEAQAKRLDQSDWMVDGDPLLGVDQRQHRWSVADRVRASSAFSPISAITAHILHTGPSIRFERHFSNPWYQRPIDAARSFDRCLTEQSFDKNHRRGGTLLMLDWKSRYFAIVLLIGSIVGLSFAHTAWAQDKKPNILVIMGDDVGWFNIGAYHRGIMSGKTPNLDKLASQGMMFTDYYAEASCTAGRANFITGELPIRTGLTTVGQAGADVGMPAQAVTLATVLKAQGYETGQFGKNHLGDLNKYLPCVHGFDEFFGYLYHLDAMSDPYWFDYPQSWIDKTGPRNLTHCWASDTDDATVMPRWGQVGKQKIVDEGPLAPFPNMKDMQNWQEGRKAKYDMETFDDVLVKSTNGFMDKAKQDGKPFFIWHNTTRMHVFSYIPPKYQAMMNATNNYNIEEAGMAQMDDSVGDILKHLEDIGEADNTIVIFTTDNGAEVFTWPDGGMTPFRSTKGTVFEGGFRVPAIIRWPGHVKPAVVENGIFSGLDWLPTLSAAAGNPDITDQLLKGVTLGNREYKNHLDGYDQMDLLTGKGPSKRHEIFYFGGPHLGAVRIDDFKYQFIQQPYGWPGEKVTTDMPTIVNLRQDPFERTPSIRGETLNDLGGGYMNNFYAREFWRFVMVQQYVGNLAKTAIDYPPMQAPASFNLQAIKTQIQQAIKQHEGE